MIFRSAFLRLAATVSLAASPALAQSPKPTPSVAPSVDSGAKSTAPAKSLSEKLNQSNGVIKPKEIDPAIEKPVPTTHDPNVIPPQAAPSAGEAQPK